MLRYSKLSCQITTTKHNTTQTLFLFSSYCRAQLIGIVVFALLFFIHHLLMPIHVYVVQCKKKRKKKSRQNKQWIQHVRDRESMPGREHMCEWRIAWERAERAHSDQQLTPFNERENSNCSNSYVYRATRARPTEALSSVPILIPSGFCSL